MSEEKQALADESSHGATEAAEKVNEFGEATLPAVGPSSTSSVPDSAIPMSRIDQPKGDELSAHIPVTVTQATRPVPRSDTRPTRIEDRPPQPNSFDAYDNNIPTMRASGTEQLQDPSFATGGMSGDQAAKSDALEFQRFLKSIAARIDPNESPNLLLSERDLLGVQQLAVGEYVCPLLDQVALIRKLGQGGNGCVYYGYQHRSGAVAVKTLLQDLVRADPGIINRFLLEAMLAKKVTSEHIVRAYEFRRNGTLNYLVMEYIDGVDAGKYLRLQIDSGLGAVPEKDAVRIAIAACKGLKPLHDYGEGTVHRDIKPQNIMIPYGRNREFQLDAAKVMDLGLAKCLDSSAPSVILNDSTKTMQGTVLGTPGFMAPEQVKDCSGVTFAADIFSIGATLYTLVTGHPPFREATPMATVAATIEKEHISVVQRCAEKKLRISKGLSLVIEQCLRKDPKERYATVSDLLADLDHVLKDEAPGAKRYRRYDAGRKWLWVAGSLAFTAACVLVLLAVFKPYEPPEIYNKQLEAAQASVDDYDFATAVESVKKAEQIRLESGRRDDARMLRKEAEMRETIANSEKAAQGTCAKILADFETAVTTAVKLDDFDDAQSQLERLAKYKAYLQNDKKDETKQLRQTYAHAESDLARAKADQLKRLNDSLATANKALGEKNLKLAEEKFLQAKKIAPQDANVLSLRKNLTCTEREGEIDAAFANNGSLAEVRAGIEEIRSLDPKRPSLAALDTRLAREEALRKTIADLDNELANVQAGAGDLGNALKLVASLPDGHPARAVHQPQIDAARGNFERHATAVREALKTEDLAAAQTQLTAAGRVWASNPDMTALKAAFAEAQTRFDGLVSAAQNEVVTDLAAAKSKFAHAQKMRPNDARVSTLERTIALEERFLSRLAAVKASVEQLDAARNYAEVGRTLKDLHDERNDARLTAVQTIFDQKYAAYLEARRKQDLATIQSELAKLGPWGDIGAPYTEFEARFEKYKADYPNEVTLPELAKTFKNKRTTAEYESLPAYASRLNDSLNAYRNGKIGLKDFEQAVALSVAKYPQGFAGQQAVLKKETDSLQEQLDGAAQLLKAKDNLEQVQAIVAKVKLLYPDFGNSPELERQLGALKGPFEKEILALPETLKNQTDLEAAVEFLKSAHKMFPHDARLPAFDTQLDALNTDCDAKLARVKGACDGGNLDLARVEFDAAAAMFPSRPGLKDLKERLLSVRKRVAETDIPELQKQFATAELAKEGNFDKASLRLAELTKRIPSDPRLTDLEEQRKAYAAKLEEERLARELKAGELTAEIEKIIAGAYDPSAKVHAKDLVTQIALVLPKDERVAKLRSRVENFLPPPPPTATNTPSSPSSSFKKPNED